MLRRELFAHPHPDIPGLLERAETLAQQLGPPPEDPAIEDDVVLCGKLRMDGREIKTIATVMRFDKPMDVTVAELRVELVFPADSSAEEFFRSLAP
ncbi:MAG: hypothetical protein GY946_05285 [bacterium]|nr:hypothetical protein [bacterium]